MTNQEVWEIALRQSACDCNCSPEDFLADTNKIVLSKRDKRARRYLPLPFACDLVSYGSNIVAQVNEQTYGAVEAYINKMPAYRCFETPQIHMLDELLKPYDLKVCFMAEYFLPDMDRLKALPCSYELRILHQEEFASLYLPQWSNALCEDRKELDVLGVGAYDGAELIGLAGCSADCEDMYQIGVDVLPAYRGQGIASALTSRLALEIVGLGKVPFYCAAWSNIRSVRNAVRSGFKPAWVELTARDTAFVNRLNYGEES